MSRPMRSLLTPLLALASLSAGLGGCDVALFPETAQYEESVAARATVNVVAVAMPGEGIEEIEVEIGQVLLHRPADDGWVVLGAQTAAVLLDGVNEQCAFENVPVGFESYDAMRVVVEAVRVRTGEGWQDADVLEAGTEAALPVDIADDVTFDVAFDLEASLAQEAQGWSFLPVFDVTSSPAPH